MFHEGQQFRRALIISHSETVKPVKNPINYFVRHANVLKKKGTFENRRFQSKRAVKKKGNVRISNSI